jgi:hypothetical protein
MRRLALAAFLCAALAPSIVAAASQGGEPTATACLIRYWTEARPRHPGYDHLVHIRNDCELPVACTIITSVNPRALRTTLAAKTEVTVLTYRGSPARRFNADVTCRPTQ